MWREVRLAALAEAPEAFKSRLEDWDNGGEAQWRARFEMPGTYNAVAVLNGRPAGMASGVPGDDGAGELRSVWVSPRARGRSVGDQLIAAVQDWAARSGRDVSPAMSLSWGNRECGVPCATMVAVPAAGRHLAGPGRR